ncbi:MAG TPA: FRG domain-containing protein [Caldisericia bacterium]|nr:FRG domain-containing protein [Caldisericia bacterium]
MKEEFKMVSVNNYNEFINFLSEFNVEDNVLFRGQEVDWPLLPKIARIAPDREILDAERKMFTDFKVYSLSYLKVRLDNDWDWLAMAQHYGLSTRLLDWSANPLIALWFAVKLPPCEDKDGVVWCFKPADEDFVIDYNNSPFSIKATKVFQPKHFSDRIRSQSAFFTAHKWDSKKNKFYKFETMKKYLNKLTKIVIPRSQFSNFRYNLDQFGINQSVVFPDLDGLCAHIQWRYTFLSDEKKLTRDQSKSIWKV